MEKRIVHITNDDAQPAPAAANGADPRAADEAYRFLYSDWLANEEFWTNEQIAQKGRLRCTEISRQTSASIGSFLAIDVRSEVYEIDADLAMASERAAQKSPEGVFFLARIGHETLGTIEAVRSHQVA